jgi:REP element-mobilizing transposase RayT
MSLGVRTTRFSRGRLPRWEVEGARYFVTVRCHGSLPAEVMARLREVHHDLQNRAPASTEYGRLQRQYFLTLEIYLDRGTGSTPLRQREAAALLVNELEGLAEKGVLVPHYTIMPNHWHALLAPDEGCTIDLHEAMARLKGRTSRLVNAALGRAGPLWQREWFDRWIRDEAEWVKCRDYIRQNPVKAGLVNDWREHSWTK